MNNLIIILGFVLIFGSPVLGFWLIDILSRAETRQHAGEDRGEGLGGLHNQDIA